MSLICLSYLAESFRDASALRRRFDTAGPRVPKEAQRSVGRAIGSIFQLKMQISHKAKALS